MDVGSSGASLVWWSRIRNSFMYGKLTYINKALQKLDVNLDSMYNANQILFIDFTFSCYSLVQQNHEM